MGSISIILVLPLLVLAMIACGPADQAIQEKIGNISQVTPQEEEETPEPCPHTEQTYPNLDDALADIVSKYETCQLTEEQAAAEAPEYHGSKVLVEIDAETNTRANTLDEWMGEQSISPRHALAEWEAPVIYAFVRVSMVGILSNQNAAGNIKASSPPFDPNVEYQSPAKALGRERASEEPPIFPAWLKGNVPSPGHYPKLRGVLGYIARQYDLGTLDLQSLKNHEFFGCYIEDEMVGGYLYILDNDKALQRIETWLSESDTEWNNERITEGQFRVIPVRILPSKLSDLSKHTDLVKVDQGVCGGMDDSSTGQPSGTNTTPEAFGTIESQGIRTIGAEDWHNNTTTQYIGSAKRIGIIDAGFKGFDTQINDGEVPTPTEYFCFNSYHDTTISNTAAECRLASSHGTAVAETVMDTAPGAQLYLSNGSLDTNTPASRKRFTKAVDELVQAQVDVIIHSVTYGYTEGPGDGSDVWGAEDLHVAVKKATGFDTGYDGALWVNSAGNSRKSTWKDAPDFDAGTANRNPYHRWLNQENRLFIRNWDGTYFTGNGNNAYVYIRWDDTWKNADCDLDLHIWRLEGTTEHYTGPWPGRLKKDEEIEQN